MERSIGTLQCTPLSARVHAGLITTLFGLSTAHAAITSCVVNTVADDPLTAATTVNASTNSGTLRDCILVANLLTTSTGVPTLPGLTITFAGALSGATVALGDDLPLLFNNTKIDASALADPVTIDGGNAHRIFFVSGLPPIPASGKPDPDGAQAIAVTLRHLILLHGRAKGGDAIGVAGGGMGAGGALFVNKFASVIVDRVSFSGNTAQGGNGGNGGGYGGGGGMGAGTSNYGGGGLGSASFAADGAGLGTAGTISASGGWGGTGLGQLSSVQGFNPTYFDVDSGAGTGGAGLIGGGGALGTPGGFGGGGGGDTGSDASGREGGFGGGGGTGGSAIGHGGNGGFGGGGGGFGEFTGAGGRGGFGGGGASTSSGSDGGGGRSRGGGAGFGGAVFVRAGASLTLQNSVAPGSITGGGVAAGTGGVDGAAAGGSMFMMSGATTTFDIAGSYAVSGSLGDDSPATLPDLGTYGAGVGAGAALTKQGTGTLTLSGANTYAGATAANAGILRIAAPGSIAASSVAVAAIGTLTGDGTTGPISSLGTLAPGTSANPQSTLHVIGTLQIQPGALTCFHANGTDAISDLNATGAATLSGIARIDFSAGPTAGTIYYPVTATSISGSFAGYETNMPNLFGHFDYTPTHVTFTVDASDVIFRNTFEPPISDSPCIAAFTN